jgi:hypothetical protein
MHPKLANRSCESCRAYQYDEATGEVAENKRDGRPMERLGKVPCDSSLGCAKGHYSKPKYRPLTAQEEVIVRTYHASKASGGRMLTDAELSDECLAALFSHLERLHSARTSRDTAAAITHGLASLRTR